MSQHPTSKKSTKTFPVRTVASTKSSIFPTTSKRTPRITEKSSGAKVGQSSSTPVCSTAVHSTASASIPSTSGAAVNKNDPKMVEQSVAKLKEFLKNLVKLAEGRKKEVQDQVQSHVQRLLVSIANIQVN